MASVIKKERAYDRYAYKNCTSSLITNSSHLFRFPRANDPRHDIWVQHTGNAQVKSWSAATRRNGGLCALHFRSENFTESGKLKRDAVPLPYFEAAAVQDGVVDGHNDKVRTNELCKSVLSSSSIHCSDAITPSAERDDKNMNVETKHSSTENERISVRRIYTNSKLTFSESDDDVMSWTTIEPGYPKSSAHHDGQSWLHEHVAKNEHTPRSNVALKSKLAQMKKQVRLLKFQLKRALNRNRGLEKKNKKKTVEEFLNEQKCMEPAARAMVKLQLHRKNAPFAEEEKDLAKQLYFYSAAAYTRLQKAGCRFPAVSTVRLWISEIDMKPGFRPVVFDKLKDKLEQLPLVERVCCLKWDEMTIKSFEEYSVKYDCIEGLVDLGQLGRCNDRARYVCVFCLDSINATNPWRQFIAYFLAGTGVKANELYELLKECLSQLREAGAKVVMTTCDQGPANQSLYSSVLGVTDTAMPSFNCMGTEYIASYDFPHLIKRLMSTLRTYGVLYCDGKVIVAYEDFVSTWRYDCRNTTSRLLFHITETHLFPSSFEAMNVKRAFQMLSHTFAAAIMTAGNDPQGLSSPTWKETAAFADRMNNVIDACNAYRLQFLNPAKRPLSDRNPRIEKILIEFIEWSSKWCVPSKKKLSLIGQSIDVALPRKIPCLLGLPMTVKAILMAYHSIKEDHPQFELAAALCNQDSVEHLFPN